MPHAIDRRRHVLRELLCPLEVLRIERPDLARELVAGGGEPAERHETIEAPGQNDRLAWKSESICP